MNPMKASQMKQAISDFKSFRSLCAYICRQKRTTAPRRVAWLLDSAVALVRGWYTLQSKEDIEAAIRKFPDVSFPEEYFGLMIVGTPDKHKLTHTHITYKGSRISVSCYVTLKKLEEGPKTLDELGITRPMIDNWIALNLVNWDGQHLSINTSMNKEKCLLDICMDNLVRRRIDVERNL